MIPDPLLCNNDCKRNIVEYDRKMCKTKSSRTASINLKEPANTTVLGQLNAQCDNNEALKSWRFKTSRDAQPTITLEYVCCPAEVNACGKKSTSELDFGRRYQNIHSLERFDYTVPDPIKQAMTGFSFTIVTKGPNTPPEQLKFKGEISYCTIFG